MTTTRHFALLTTALALLNGCASEPKVLPASAHAATSPESVRILAKQPSAYEQLATVTLVITPELRWDEKGDANRAFDLLKQGAAVKGANAILLSAPGRANVMAVAGYRGTSYQLPIQAEDGRKTAVVQAVYVVEP